MLSGTMLNNRWTDIGNIVIILKGHPFSDKGKFLNAFSVSPTGTPRFKLVADVTSLQRFLLACVVSRPSSCLELPDLTCEDSKFNLNERERDYVQQATEMYAKRKFGGTTILSYRHGHDATAMDNPSV